MREPVLVDLALQGGGSHGAFRWGVLDRILEEPWLKIDGISGTSPHRGEVPKNPWERSRPSFDLKPQRAFGAGLNMGLLGILIALGVLIWLAYRGWSVLVLAPAAALAAAATGQEPLLAHWTQTFMGSTAQILAQFFPIFLLGALFGKLMEDSGSVEASPYLLRPSLPKSAFSYLHDEFRAQRAYTPRIHEKYSLCRFDMVLFGKVGKWTFF